MTEYGSAHPTHRRYKSLKEQLNGPLHQKSTQLAEDGKMEVALVNSILKNQYQNFNSNETRILSEISQIHKKQYLSKKMRNESMEP